MGKKISYCGFNMVESLLRHTPEQLEVFLNRMNTLRLNTLIVQYDYGFKHYRELLLQYCSRYGIELRLMVFGPRSFFRLADWNPDMLSRQKDGKLFTDTLECETWPCRYAPRALEQFEYGAERFFAQLPVEIKYIQMRSGDGYNSCCCPQCRQHTIRDNWQPFVAAFIRAGRKIRPDVKLEADVYLKRYELPSDLSVYAALDSIMYDTFMRYPRRRLNAFSPNQGAMPLLLDDTAPSLSPNEYHGQQILQWSKAFPGKITVHENIMMQSYYGINQFNTRAMLDDLDFFAEAGVNSVLYEAYEPGFRFFAPNFEAAARKFNGIIEDYSMNELEKRLSNHPCPDGLFNITDIDIAANISDPVMRKNFTLRKKLLQSGSPEDFRNYANFACENTDSLDTLFIVYNHARQFIQSGQLDFSGAPAEARKMLAYRKLWDYMENLPEPDKAVATCLRNINYLISNVRSF